MQMQTIVGGSDWRTPLQLGQLRSRWAVGTFRTLGDAAGSQVTLAIKNGSATRRLVVVDALYWYDTTTATTSPNGEFRLGRNVNAALIGGGSALTKALMDTRFSDTDAAIAALGATASDSGAATAITGAVALNPGNGLVLARGATSGMHTLAGQRLSPQQSLVSALSPSVINPGEALVVAYVGPAGSNPATAQHAVLVVVEEYGA